MSMGCPGDNKNTLSRLGEAGVGATHLGITSIPAAIEAIRMDDTIWGGNRKEK